MAIFTVTTTNDVVNPGDGILGLREALTEANATAEDTVQFSSAVEGHTIVLASSQLTVTR